MQIQISLKQPGPPTKLPQYILQDLKNLHPRYKRNLNFFGGHPVSITKQSFNTIANELVQNIEGRKESPYLLCQKTDGVRYIMVLAHVEPNDVVKSQNESQSINGYGSHDKFSPVQCYLISREGQKGLVAYAADLKLGKGWAKRKAGNFKHIIQILDGELIIDHLQNKSVCKYLIFDILVHLYTNITSVPLFYRLKQIQKFVHMNNFLLQNVPKQQQSKQIPMQIKDFFRLNSEKYNIVKFLLNKYIKCLPHQNDGLIFNHQAKQYEFGPNDGYIKWKPAHLNTLDFMLVPNTKLADKFGNRILDLYLATRDTEGQGNYVRSFYAFTIVSEAQFDKISQTLEENKIRVYEQKQQNQDDFSDKGHFQGAVIAQCKFGQTDQEQKNIFRQLFDIKKDSSQIFQDVMKPYNQKAELERITSLQKQIYDRCWKIYKVRQDKGLPNNVSVAVKIQQSIKDNIQEEDLIKMSEQINAKCRPMY